MAAIGIGAFAVLAMVQALVMPNPGSPPTAPGLLPFLTGLSLLAMAAGLALEALRRGATLRPSRTGSAIGGDPGAEGEGKRALLLIGLSAGMDQHVAIMFMLGVYTGSVFGGAISAVLICIPGPPTRCPPYWRAIPSPSRARAAWPWAPPSPPPSWATGSASSCWWP